MQKLSQGVFVVVVVVGEKNVCGGVFYFLFFQSTTAHQQPLVKVKINNIYESTILHQYLQYICCCGSDFLCQ
jgi:hypothetical protein